MSLYRNPTTLYNNMMWFKVSVQYTVHLFALMCPSHMLPLLTRHAMKTHLPPMLQLVLKQLCAELEHRFIKLGVLACRLYFSLQLQLNDLGLQQRYAL